jgi:hypothetical protein
MSQIRRRAPQLHDKWNPDDGVIPQRPVACTVLPWFSFGFLYLNGLPPL